MPPRARYAKAPTIDTTQPNLVIVESPAKAKTISKFLGKGYAVVASMGHIRDLPKGKGAIDIAHNFTPTYEISPDKTAVVATLRKAAKAMKQVWLATDEDREGEAIARHLCEALGLDSATTPRIVFHEITKEAIEHAIAHPRKLDLNLVDAQQARRILDRLVGFELSPILWKKIKPQLSAGRVQSVAVRLLVEREREIQKFSSTAWFKVTWLFNTSKNEPVAAELNKWLKETKEVDALFMECKDATYTVADVQKKPWTKSPSPPFTTSSLQQAGSSKLGYSVSRTMQLAQRLYEAGHITYMRTDSLNLSGSAIMSAKEEIIRTYGEKYSHPRNFSSKAKNAQEAHEAIRPTNIRQERAGEDESQKKLYHLIRQRTIASQMAPALVEKTVATIDFWHPTYNFVATGEVVIFDGFLTVYGNPQNFTSAPKKPKKDDDEESAGTFILPPLKKGDILSTDRITAMQTFSKPPARYGEASLVKALEELGIGRPSTYAPTISTIQKRWYVENRDYDGVAIKLQKAVLSKWKVTRWEENKYSGAYRKKLVPTDIGLVVNDFLVEYFPNILDYQFTAQVEEEFDIIADGKLERHKMIATFYSPFHGTVETVTETAERVSGERILGTDPVSGRVVKVRIGRFGPMVQIGEAEDEDKKFASIRGNHRIESITLEEALGLFALPRSLGEREWHDLKASVGRFGPYIQWNSTFASMRKGDDPYTVTRERAIELIAEKVEKDKARMLQTFIHDDKEGVIMKWKRWPFIKRNRKLVKLPKWTDGATISHEEIVALLATAKWGAKTKKAKGTTKKKSAKKKTTKKKTIAKKGATMKSISEELSTKKKAAPKKKKAAPKRKTA